MKVRRVMTTVALAVVIVGVLLLPRTARAALMSHYDLDSLAFESTTVVLATKVRERTVDQYTKMTTVRVKRIYLEGGLKEGSAIELELYSLVPMWGWPDDAKPSISPDMILFLGRRPEKAAPGPPWHLVASGMRIFVDGKVHRFHQEMNPGGYGPTPGEGPADADAEEDATTMPFDLPSFERELARAMDRAKAVHTALAEPPSPTRTAKLVELAGRSGDDGFGEDRIGAAIVTALGHEGNVNAMLDAYARAPRIHAFGLRHGISVGVLSNLALNTTTPLHRRLAALSMIEGGSVFELMDKPDISARLATLLDDPELKIRRATLELRFADGKMPKAFSDGIVRRFKVEKDPTHRISLFAHARNYGLESKLDLTGVEMPLVAAEYERREIVVRWAGLDDRVGHYPDNLIIEVRPTNGAPARRKDFTRERGGSSSSTYFTVPLRFDPPLIPGTYDVDIDLTMKSAANDRVEFTRKITLTAQLGPAPPLPPATTTASAAAPSSSTARAPPSTIPTPPKARACGCIVVGGSTKEQGGSVLAAIALFVLVLRRTLYMARTGVGAVSARRSGS